MANDTTTKTKPKPATTRNRIAARSRIALGLVFLLVSVLWVAIAIGIVPSERSAAMSGRAQFCEAVAVFSSTLVQRQQDHAALRGAFEGMIARNPDVLSAGLRRADGTFLAEVGDHRGQWDTLSGQAALESYIQVPIFNGQRRWGTAELRFRPISQPGVIGYVNTPQTKLILFVGSACLGLFLLYLRKMLQHLDPAKAVPSRVRSALDTLAEGLLVLDNNERVVLANQTFAALVGRPPEELLGARAAGFKWVREAADESSELPWTTAIRTGGACRGATIRFDDAAGTRHTFSANCSPVLGHDGKYRGVLVSLDDVTRLEAQEQELRRAKDDADAANRAKSDFLARMSHEIRTPMNAILGFADVLRRGFEEGEAQRAEYLQTIHASGQHLLELINDVLDLSKIEAGKLEVERVRCDPAALLDEVAAVLGVKARQKGLALAVEWEGPAPATVLTDPTRVRQAVTNLVGNAIKFTAAGSVRVVAKLLADGPVEPRLRVRVIDTGAGVPPEALDRIFTPFAQADSSVTRKFGGTGLGLSISKQIAEALGGGLTVTSELGQGSTFTLELTAGPMDGVAMLDPADAGPRAAAAARPTELPADLRGVRVLLVEDGVSNRKLATLVLTRAGASVDSAEDGQQGVDRALAGRYDVVLMDMQMPVMDGYTAARLLRDRGYAGPVIALTAHAMRGDEERCRAAGCSGFLTKPIDMDLMVRTVRAAAGPIIAVPGADADPRTDRRETSHAAAPMLGTSADVATGGEAPDAEVPTPATELPLVSSLPADDAEFCQIIGEFVDRMREQLDAMQSAWSAGDLLELAALSHWVKGSGGTAGFHALTAPAKALETAARERRLDEIAGGIDELRRLADRMVKPAVEPAPAGVVPIA